MEIKICQFGKKYFKVQNSFELLRHGWKSNCFSNTIMVRMRSESEMCQNPFSFFNFCCKVSRDSNNFFSRLEKEIIKKVPESLFKSTDSDVLSLGKLLIIFSQLIINTRLVDSYLANSILVFSSLSISSSSRRYTHPVCNLTPEPIFINQPHTRLCFARSCRIHFWYFPHLNCSVEFFTLRRSSQSNS